MCPHDFSENVLLRRGHSDWSASSGQPSYYFLWPAASGRARTECDIVLISLCWKKRMHLALTRAWPGGGRLTPPLPNIRDSSKTNSAIDVKLGRPSHTTILHRPWNFFWNPSENFEIWSILWRHYTPLLVENWPNFAGLWKTQFLMKMQMENTKRRKMWSSTRWLSRFFKILGFWPLNF